jgi:hypothetical protein
MNKVVFVSNVGVVRMEIGPSPQGLPRCLHCGTDRHRKCKDQEEEIQNIKDKINQWSQRRKKIRASHEEE